MSSAGHAQAEIQVTGTISPNPISRSIPEGTPITLHLELTLQNADLPLSFHTKNSFVMEQQSGISRWRVNHAATGAEVASRRLDSVMFVAGPVVNVDTDLLTLHPDIPVPCDVTCKLYIDVAVTGQRQPYFFGSRLSSMEAGETFHMSCPVGVAPIRWCYWGTKEDVIKDRELRDDGVRTFQARPTKWEDCPKIVMSKPIEFEVTE